MALLPIVMAPDRRLRMTCEPVAEVDDRVRRLMDDMLETMYEAPGIGLAAPQVGVTRSIIVVDIKDEEEGEQPHPYQLANPRIVWESDELVEMSEGCLSLPDIYVDVVRPAAVKIRYLDRTGRETELAAEGLLSRCLQHEIGHLSGALHVDYLSTLRRKMILRKLEKQRRLAMADDD